nr:MAG TPA: hypothetical protein [Caudoviricetes sp.]
MDNYITLEILRLKRYFVCRVQLHIKRHESLTERKRIAEN